MLRVISSRISKFTAENHHLYWRLDRQRLEAAELTLEMNARMWVK